MRHPTIRSNAKRDEVRGWTASDPLMVNDLALSLVADLLLDNISQALNGRVLANPEHPICGMRKVRCFKKFFNNRRNMRQTSRMALILHKLNCRQFGT